MPLALGVIALASAGYSAYTQYQGGKAAQRLNEYNAKQEEINAAAATRDAGVSANAERVRNRQVMGKIRTAYGASGVAGDTGSPLLTQLNAAANLEMGALETERQGGITASRHLQQAELDRMAGKTARYTGGLNATATILQGVSNAAGSYANYKGTS